MIATIPKETTYKRKDSFRLMVPEGFSLSRLGGMEEQLPLIAVRTNDGVHHMVGPGIFFKTLFSRPISAGQIPPPKETAPHNLAHQLGNTELRSGVNRLHSFVMF